MKQPTSISIWSVVGLILGFFLLFVFFGLTSASAGLYLYCGQLLLIGVIDLIFSVCAALFSNASLSFAVGYSIPFTLHAVDNTVSVLYIREGGVPLNIGGILFWWGLAMIIFLIGFAGGHIGRSLHKHRSQPGE